MNPDPNSFDAEIKDAQANPEAPTQGTEVETPTEPNPTLEAEPDVETPKGFVSGLKFAESQREALRLLEENRRIRQELEAKGTEPTADTLYPGFENLDEEAQKNLIAYTNAIARRAKDEILKDPAISHARTTYNETRFNEALAQTIEKYPELKDAKSDFKSKYYNPKLVPENIQDILSDVAKMYLFDQAKVIGAKEEKAKLERMDMERPTAGDKTPKSSRTLEDWSRMASENPHKFAQLSKEYQADLESGKI
jgi:hypothetical protein